MNISNFIQELKRRNVFKVATAYAIAGWLIIQIATSVFPAFEFPNWTSQFVIILVFIGFPISIIIAWAFELTADGLKTTKQVDEDDSISHNTGKKLNGLIIGLLSVIILFLVIERFFFAGSTISDDITPVSTIVDKSIAVLPFDDFNAGGDQEYFADGLTEEILNSLAKTSDLLVASRTSSFQYKDKNIDIMRIADTLGVAHILEGSIRASSEKYRITAQLIRASDGFHLWSETYDRPKSDIIDIQEEIAFEIALALETAMDPVALAEMVKSGTSSVEAFNEYLEGLSLKYDITIDDFMEMYNHFETARTLDPTFASAHYQSASFWISQVATSSMGSNLVDESYQESLVNFSERMELAIEYANATDKINYEAYLALVNLEYRRSIDLYSQYLELRPNDFEAFSNLIQAVSYLGEYDLGYEIIKGNNPFNLSNSIELGLLIPTYYWINHAEEGKDLALESADKFPYDESMLYQAHRLLLWAGEYDKAREVVQKITGRQLLDESVQVARIRQHCADGEYEKANEIHDSVEYFRNKGGNWISLMTLDRKEEAYDFLKESYENDEFYSMTSWLYYRYFDYKKFPKLEEILIRENHKRGPVIEIPFRCGR